MSGLVLLYVGLSLPSAVIWLVLDFLRLFRGLNIKHLARPLGLAS